MLKRATLKHTTSSHTHVRMHVDNSNLLFSTALDSEAPLPPTAAGCIGISWSSDPTHVWISATSNTQSLKWHNHRQKGLTKQRFILRRTTNLLLHKCDKWHTHGNDQHKWKVPAAHAMPSQALTHTTSLSTQTIYTSMTEFYSPLLQCLAATTGQSAADNVCVLEQLAAYSGLMTLRGLVGHQLEKTR